MFTDIISQKSVPADNNYVLSFESLKGEMRRRGLFQKDTSRVLAELVFHCLLAGCGLAAFVVLTGILCKAAATIVWTAGLLGIATNTHTSAHYATFQSKWLNELLTFVGFPVITGISATHWWKKHFRHHKNPNIVGIDKDLDLKPYFVVTDVEKDCARGMARVYYSIQLAFLPFAVCLIAFNWQKNSLLFLVAMLADASQRRVRHYVDLVCVFLHFVVWIVIPCLFADPLSVLGFYGLKYVTLGCATFVTFAPSHFPQDAACAPSTEQNADFVLKQTATTVNYHTGFLGRLLCSGLGYQIEHHLFPQLSHTRYPMASELVVEFCRNHGYPYRTLYWTEAVVKACCVFVKPKRVVSSLQDCRSPNDARSGVVMTTATIPGTRRERPARATGNGKQ